MKIELLKKKASLIVAAALAAVLLTSAAVLFAGQIKEGGPYKIMSDSLTSGGSAGVVEDSTYRVLYSVGQSAGAGAQTGGGGISLEGGFVSGIEAAFILDNAIAEIEAPAGHSGGPQDAVPGARITYRLEFENRGEAAINAVVSTDGPLPSELEFDRFATGSLKLVLNNVETIQDPAVGVDSCDVVAEEIVCEIADIAAGATGAVVFRAVIK